MVEECWGWVLVQHRYTHWKLIFWNCWTYHQPQRFWCGWFRLFDFVLVSADSSCAQNGSGSIFNMGMSQNDAPFLGLKMFFLRMKQGASFWDIHAWCSQKLPRVSAFNTDLQFLGPCIILMLQHKPAGLRGLVAGILAFALLRGVDILPTNHDALTRHIRTQLATSIAHVNMVSHVSNACSSQRAPSLDIDHAN